MGLGRQAWTLTALLLGCTAPEATVVVEVRTDLSPGVDFATVRTEVEVLDRRVEASAEARAGDDFLRGVRVAELRTPEDPEALVHVRLLRPGGGVLVQRAVRVPLRGAISVTVLIASSCVGVACGDGEACYAGACVPDDCRLENPAPCGPGMCLTGADCALPTPCSTAPCVEGNCFVSRRECPDGGPVDGGAGDAGLACGPGESRACVTTCGSAGFEICDAAGTFGACQAPLETCNGADDDCDGRVDEALTFEPRIAMWFELPGCDSMFDGFSLECRAAFHDLCQRSDACVNTGYGVVASDPTYASGFCVQAALESTSWAELGSFVPACDETRRGNVECAEAIDGLCRVRGHAAGFYLLPGDALVAACFSATQAAVEMVDYAELEGFSPGCNGVGLYEGFGCNEAINRACRERGYRTGLGPVRHTRFTATVVCLREPT